MAVTFTPTLTLASTTTGTDALSFSVTKDITLGDNDVRLTKTFSPGAHGSSAGVQIFDTNLGKSYIYVKNVHASSVIHLGAANNTNTTSATWMELAIGEFAFFSWAGYADIFALTASGTATAGLEVTIFEA